MAVEIGANDDLQELRFQILGDIRNLLTQQPNDIGKDMRGYKTKYVTFLLGWNLYYEL